MTEDHGEEEDRREEPDTQEDRDERMARELFVRERTEQLTQEAERAAARRRRNNDGEQDRSTRRRTEERRGTRRNRDNEGDEDEQNRDQAWRRVGAINKAVNDIIELKHDYARKSGIKYDDKCDRETARKIIDDLDKRYERRLRKFQDRERNAGASEPRRQR